MTNTTKAALEAQIAAFEAKVADADACAARALEGRDEMIRQCQALEAENRRLRDQYQPNLTAQAEAQEYKDRCKRLKLKLHITRAKLRLLRLDEEKRG